MIELPVRPKHVVVAVLARRRIIQRNVVNWRLRVVVVRLVARHAGRAGQLVVVVDVAQRALQSRMGSGQGKAGCGVVKRRARPIGSAVAAIAGRWQAQRDMVDRRLRTVVILLMAAHTGRSGQVVVVVDVA